MLGTLNGALEVRGVSLPSEAMQVSVDGVNEVRNGIPVLTLVAIRYTLRIPKGSREVVDRALARHQAKCPTASTLKGAVEVSWTAEIDEV